MAIWSLQLLTEQYCRRLTTQSLTAADLYKTQGTRRGHIEALPLCEMHMKLLVWPADEFSPEYTRPSHA